MNLAERRYPQKVKVVEPASDDDEDGPSLFIAQPTDDIPRNKLVEKLARGLQGLVQRMQKRDAFYVNVVKMQTDGWIPAPRECSSLTTVRNRAYLVGGLNHGTNREVSQLSVPGASHMEIEMLDPMW